MGQVNALGLTDSHGGSLQSVHLRRHHILIPRSVHILVLLLLDL